MTKVAFVFPGQGSQRVAMGAEILQDRPEVFNRFLTLADSVSGLPIRRLSQEGPIESLTSTDVAQPALFAVSLAVTELARERGLSPDFVAGHSLGEYTAAVVSGALSVEDGMGLVCERGRLMAASQSQRPGAMAAIIGLEATRVQELCTTASQEGVVATANVNSPSQIVVSGEEAAVMRMIDLATEAGAKRAVRLQVGAAFHSELMKPVQDRLAEAMQGLSWNEPTVPMASNASGKLVSSGQGVQQALVAQIASPVLWVDCVQTLVGEGVTRFLELGPGRVLGGLVRQIHPESETFAADSPQKLAELADRVSA